MLTSKYHLQKSIQANPRNYRTRSGLYSGTVQALSTLTTVRRAWWIHTAIYHCEQEFPDLLPQLKKLVYGEITLETLSTINEVLN